MTRKVVDCFIFYNELDMLEFRLHELADVVDIFVLAEGTATFRGETKPLFFKENIERFARFLPRIHSIVVPLENADGSWQREWTLRNALATPLQRLELRDDDLCILSDVDEIPDSQTLARLKNDGVNEITALAQDFYYYNLTCKAVYQWKLSHAFPFSVTRSMSMQDNRTSQSSEISRGGWHFSNFMSVDKIANKYHTGAHEGEFEKFFHDINFVERLISDRKDMFGRQEVEFIHEKLATNAYLPREVARLEQFFAGETLIK